MTVVLNLKRLLMHCPQNWQNFIKDLDNQKLLKKDNDGYGIDLINQDLSRYNAEYIPSKNYNNSKVVFQKESGYLLFQLKYGLYNATLDTYQKQC